MHAIAVNSGLPGKFSQSSSHKPAMTRKKVTLAYIANDSARKATFKKRKKGLIKKVSELSTLCGIEACAVIYSPYDTEPEVWPSVVGAHRAIARFRSSRYNPLFCPP